MKISLSLFICVVLLCQSLVYSQLVVPGKITCANIRCGFATICIDGKCVPRSGLTCDTVRCRSGYHCREIETGPQCVKNEDDNSEEIIPGKGSCLTVKCNAETICVDGKCVPRPVLTCATVDCRQGYYCKDTKTGPKCLKNKEGKGSCVKCNSGTICVDRKCVPTCAVIDCKPGYNCKDTKTGGKCEKNKNE